MKVRLSGDQGALFLLALVVFVAGVAVFGWASESTAGAVAMLAVAAAFVFGSIAYAVVRPKRIVEVSLDDGGLRVAARSGGRHYLAFDELRSASTRTRFGGGAVDVVTSAGRTRYLLEHAPPPELEAALQEGIARSRARAGLESLARSGQPLDAWLLRLRDRSVADYRERPIDPEALLAAVEDRTAPAEIRAAAAHMLVWLRDHEKATRVMATLGPSTPPIVVVAATLATKRGTYVAEYEEALTHLSAADRVVAARMIDERPVLDARVRVASDAGADLLPERAAGEEREPDEPSRRGVAE